MNDQEVDSRMVKDLMTEDHMKIGDHQLAVLKIAGLEDMMIGHHVGR